MSSRKLFIAVSAAFAILSARPVEAAKLPSKDPAAAGDVRSKAHGHRGARAADVKRQAHPQKRHPEHDAKLDWPQLG